VIVVDKEQELLISSRVRLARNIRDCKFPTKWMKEEANKVITETSDALKI